MALKTPQKQLDYAKKYYLENKEKRLAYLRGYKKSHRKQYAAYQRKYKKNNPAKIKEMNKKHQKEWQRKMNKFHYNWMREIRKGKSCSKCGEAHPSCLDFHHLDPSKKIGTVYKVLRKHGVKHAMEEIEKCIILCANCHRKEHYNAKPIV